MISKINIFLVIILILICSPKLMGEQKDMIVLLDISRSVFSIFDGLVNYLINDALRYQLSLDDNFHLITFSGTPEIEISRKIENNKDVEEILKEILLLYPFGEYTDLIRALKYLYQYTYDLPANTEKIILILTDGIHDPPPGSPFQEDKANIEEEIKNIAEKMDKMRWKIHLLKLPEEKEETPEREATDFTLNDNGGELKKRDLFPALSETLDIPAIEYREEEKENVSSRTFRTPSIIFPGYLGRVNQVFTAPFRVKNNSDEPIRIKLLQVLWSDKNILKKEISVKLTAFEEKTLKATMILPDTTAPGEKVMNIELVFSGDLPVSPREGVLQFYLKERKGLSLSFPEIFPSTVLFLVGLIMFACIIFLVAFTRKAIERSMPVEYESYQATRQDFEKLYREYLRRPIEMRVYSQTSNIGLRNVHFIKEESKLYIGGKDSDFLIFISPFPRDIGFITYSRGKYILVPIRKEYFPSLNAPLEGCLEREITARSETGKEIIIVFREYVSPLERINRVMHLIDQPGLNTI